MKNKSIILSIAIVIIVAISQQLVSSPDGAVSGVANDPLSNSANCTSCHSGTAYTRSGWITSNIPLSGYVPNTTYTITATMVCPTRTKFGFEISPQNSLGTKLGTLIVTNSAQTKLVGSSKYITHTTGGNTGTNGTKTWTFDWTAPAVNSGQVNFYGSFLGANNNGSSSGDSTFITTYSVLETCNFKSPTNIFATPKGTSVTINWTKNACANGYKIMYRPVGGATWKYATIPDTSTKNLYSLSYSTDYEYAIASLSGTTLSTYSATKYFTTLCQCDTTIMVADSIGKNAVKFLWVDDSCGVRYKLQYRKLGVAFWTSKIVLDTTDNIVVTGLSANTTYEWRYRKECNLTGTYSSAWSNIWQLTTTALISNPQVERVLKLDNMTIYYYNDGSIRKEIKVDTFK
jgi:hypothetical protein